MTTLTRLLYVSAARDGVDGDEVERIMARARAHNAKIGVGGCLLFYGGRFLQVLEGPRPALEQLFGRIQADPRHHGVRVLLHVPAPERDFADWSMRLLPMPARPDRAVTAFLANLGHLRDGRDAQLALALLRRLGRPAPAASAV